MAKKTAVKKTAAKKAEVEASPEVEASSEVEASPEVEAEASTPALVEDDIVTRRGKGMGGVTRIKRSEYDAMKKKGG